MNLENYQMKYLLLGFDGEKNSDDFRRRTRAGPMQWQTLEDAVSHQFHTKESLLDAYSVPVLPCVGYAAVLRHCRTNLVEDLNCRPVSEKKLYNLSVTVFACPV